MSETINSVLSDKLRDANETIVAQRSELDRLRSRERELMEALERTTTALEQALEELRLIRMKDCSAVYDNMIRRFGPVAAQDARSILKGGE